MSERTAERTVCTSGRSDPDLSEIPSPWWRSSEQPIPLVQLLQARRPTESPQGQSQSQGLGLDRQARIQAILRRAMQEWPDDDSDNEELECDDTEEDDISWLHNRLANARGRERHTSSSRESQKRTDQ